MASIQYKAGLLLSIEGTIKEIKSEKTFGNEKIVVYFILLAPGKEQAQEYMIRAFSRSGHDRFNIIGQIGKQVTCNVYLNGQKKPTDKGIYHHNELSLHSIQ